MATILHIDTSGSTAAICIASNASISSYRINENRNDHAAFLQPAIIDVLKEQNISFNQLDAIAVSMGPGSYTGLRVGLSSAKGLCYALNLPLITINSLQIIALAGALEHHHPKALYVAMIDARRMEVFTAIYDSNAKEIVAPQALVLQPNSYESYLIDKKIIFLGDGAEKFSRICTHKNAIFLKSYQPLQAFVNLAFENFNTNFFANLAYAEPLYVKEFYDNKK